MPKKSPCVLYRFDIDGLRAIAVISILLFHANLFGVTGGFIGVDIFFVISGYLITSLIQKELVNNSFSLKLFYLRRIRRLFPALALVLLVTWLGGFLLLSDESFKELAKTALCSLFFVSNWYFLRQSNYFDSVLEMNALLHTWSLSIEEQYYLVWPFILIFLHSVFKSNIKLQSGLIILFLMASLTLSIYLVYFGLEKSAFFNTLGRFW